MASLKHCFALAVIATASLVTPLVHATEVITQLEAYWIQPNGDLVFYGSEVGPCIYNSSNTSIYLVRTSLANFDQLSDGLNIAMVKGYKVSLVVESCDLNENVVTFAKVCKNPSYC